MTSIHLRDYQREAIDAVFKAWADGMQRPAIVLPTGAGKTVVFAALIKEFRAAQESETYRLGSGMRVIVLAHRDELVDQAIAKVRAVMPGVNVGKVKAQDNDVHADVMVCSVQTLASENRREQLRYFELNHGKIGLIITDECHHAAAKSYQSIYEAFPDALQLGVTATMARGDGVGLGSTWDDVVYKRSILNLIAKKHLVDVRTKRIDLKALDMGGIKSSRGDWQAGDLGQALMDAEADTAIARAYKQHADDRRGIVFTPTVETAYAACKALRDSGIRSTVVDGETPREVRQEAYEQFRRGQTQVLVNCMVLTEGFDAPWAEVAVIARPTQSAPLYTQMAGRVLRTHPGKTEALILDLVGASSHKLRTLIDLEPGAVKEILDGESLAEAVIREETEANKRVKAGSLAFELKVRDVDAFAASGTTWTRTPKGVLFISCGTVRVFLWPGAEAGTWDVCMAPDGGKWEQTAYTGLAIGEAMAWAEAVSEDFYGGFSTRTTARWRTGEPSKAQVSRALSWGIKDPESMTRGELSKALDLAAGAELFDPHVKA